MLRIVGGHHMLNIDERRRVFLHRKRALAMERKYGADIRLVSHELTVHLLKGEAWVKATQTMSIAIKCAVLNFTALRAAAGIVNYIVTNSSCLPTEIPEHLLRLLSSCQCEVARMTLVIDGDMEILKTANEAERRDSLICNLSLMDRVERLTRFLEDHYLFGLGRVSYSVSTDVAKYFLNEFITAVEECLPHQVQIVTCGCYKPRIRPQRTLHIE